MLPQKPFEAKLIFSETRAGSGDFLIKGVSYDGPDASKIISINGSCIISGRNYLLDLILQASSGDFYQVKHEFKSCPFLGGFRSTDAKARLQHFSENWTNEQATEFYAQFPDSDSDPHPDLLKFFDEVSNRFFNPAFTFGITHLHSERQSHHPDIYSTKFIFSVYGN
jgi:hypothetical protein